MRVFIWIVVVVTVVSLAMMWPAPSPPKAIVRMHAEMENVRVTGRNVFLLPQGNKLGELTGNIETIDCLQDTALPDAAIIDILMVTIGGHTSKGPSNDIYGIPKKRAIEICRALYDEAKRQEDENYRR